MKIEGKVILKSKIEYLYSQSNVSDFVAILIANGYTVTIRQVSDKYYIDYSIDSDF